MTDTTQWGEVAASRRGRKEQTDRDSLGEALQCRDVHWGKKPLPEDTPEPWTAGTTSAGNSSLLNHEGLCTQLSLGRRRKYEYVLEKTQSQMAYKVLESNE